MEEGVVKARLYQVIFESEAALVEAENLLEAITIWRASLVARGGGFDGTEEPDFIESVGYAAEILRKKL